MTSNLNHTNSPYYNKYSKYLKNYTTNNNINTPSELNIPRIKQKNHNTDNDIPLIKKNINSSKNKKRNLNNLSFNFDHINIFGIDLFSDDILLILLIYFLYTEGVKDIYLFIVLILLLLS